MKIILVEGGLYIEGLCLELSNDVEVNLGFGEGEGTDEDVLQAMNQY